MKLCPAHWYELLQAISTRGLNHFVHKSGKEACEAAVNELDGTNTIKDWDPLMSANYSIWSAGLKHVGLVLMNGDMCPICEALSSLNKHIKTCVDPSCLAKNNLDYVNQWITLAADGQLEYARENKLVPPVQ